METRWDTARTEAFSDGVFAIAITLLVLDLTIPRAEYDDLRHALFHEWPGYLGYVTSFLTIGGFWLVHHGIMRRLAAINQTLMRLNLLILMAVAFLPFPTRLMADAIRDSDAERTAVTFYGISLFVIAVLFGLFWTAARHDRSLLQPEVTEREIGYMTRLTTPNIGFYAVMIAVGLRFPKGAAFGYLAIAILAVLRARGDHERRSA